MISFQNAKYIKSTPDIANAPKGNFPEVLIIGKSNVGKSSLINALTNQKRLAYTSSKPGRTRLLNYFDIDQKFYLVDAPGYGFAKGNIDLDKLFKTIMDDYFQNSKFLKLVLLLLDSRREISENDVTIINYLEDKKISYQIVFTKKDKINQKETAALMRHIKQIGLYENECMFVSINNPVSINKLQKIIEKSL